MTAQEKANKLEALFNMIGDLHEGTRSLTLHSFEYVYDLDDTWNKDTVLSNGTLTILASKDGITLFGQTFYIDREPQPKEKKEEL